MGTETEQELRAALKRSMVAIDDWLHTFASELCNAEKVKETYMRIEREGGTLYYIAIVQEQNRKALGL